MSNFNSRDRIENNVGIITIQFPPPDIEACKIPDLYKIKNINKDTSCCSKIKSYIPFIIYISIIFCIGGLFVTYLITLT